MCIIGDEAAEEEERQRWSTPSTVNRAYQRAIDSEGSSAADDVRVQRYMRKLSKSLAMRGAQLVRNKHGQLVLPGAVRNERGQAMIEVRSKVISLDGRTHTRRVLEVAGHRIPTRAPGAPRKLAYGRTDAVTGEIRRVTAYRVGYYHGGAGFLLVNDGRVTGRSIARYLGATWELAA